MENDCVIKRCVVCGAYSEDCICPSCLIGTDVEALCHKILAFKPGTGENPLWEEMAASLDNPYALRDSVINLSRFLPFPRDEYIRFLCSASFGLIPVKDKRSLFYEECRRLLDLEGISNEEKIMMRTRMLGTYLADYMYDEAEEEAVLLAENDSLTEWEMCVLGDYYIKTRRYDKAGAVLEAAHEAYPQSIEVVQLLEDRDRRMDPSPSGKKEYMPAPKEGKEKYAAFMRRLGITVHVVHRDVPKPIAREEYPQPNVTYETDFDSFTAFDLETTGFSSTKDSIIEIGAVKVVRGEIVGTFQEFVKPYRSYVGEQITQKTGIYPSDVENAREMWEVVPDFMKFAGSDVLLGFNCNGFDSHFMVRAGRYSHIIIDNKYFDVMLYADRFKHKFDLTCRKVSLKDISEALQIENPQAHRALADAITTARVYLKLKEMESAK
ncbi:MAG: exonuclease domain-containing protein [Christensenellales bacterium]|jgi:DNA polymerase III epsilon subunit family exonuclease